MIEKVKLNVKMRLKKVKKTKKKHLLCQNKQKNVSGIGHSDLLNQKFSATKKIKLVYSNKD